MCFEKIAAAGMCFPGPAFQPLRVPNPERVPNPNLEGVSSGQIRRSGSCAIRSAGASLVNCCHHQCSKSHAGGSTGGVSYTVMPGDTLLSIASAHNIGVTAILDANPSITDPDSLTPGEVITLPTATAAGG